MARVTSPPEVVDLLGDHDVGAREEDEFMSLAIALGYAVMISALSGVGMMISGDRSAWPAEWGDLVEVPSARVMQFRSH